MLTPPITCGIAPLGYAVSGPAVAAINTAPPARTADEARQWMDEQGLSQAELARRFGVTSSLVDAILRGNKPCKRGASHNIAVFLGLKHGQAVAKRQSYRGSSASVANAGAAA